MYGKTSPSSPQISEKQPETQLRRFFGVGSDGSTSAAGLVSLTLSPVRPENPKP